MCRLYPVEVRDGSHYKLPLCPVPHTNEIFLYVAFLGDNRYAPPTEEEERYLRQPEAFFCRNLLRLQVQEVLADVHLSGWSEQRGSPTAVRKALTKFLFTLRETLLGMKSGVSQRGQWTQSRVQCKVRFWSTCPPLPFPYLPTSLFFPYLVSTALGLDHACGGLRPRFPFHPTRAMARGLVGPPSLPPPPSSGGGRFLHAGRFEQTGT